MSIQYACVARGKTILVQCALSSGNYDVSALDVLAKMYINQQRATYDRSKVRYFVLRDDIGINYLAASEESFPLADAFAILEDIQRRFMMQFARNWRTVESYGLQSEFSDQLKSIIQNSTNLKIKKIQNNLEAAQDQMTKNLQSAMIRGDTIEDLNDKAYDIEAGATEFRRTANVVRRRMCWEKYKYYLLVVVVLIVLIFIIVAIACDGITFPSCRSRSSSSSTPAPQPNLETQ